MADLARGTFGFCCSNLFVCNPENVESRTSQRRFTVFFFEGGENSWGFSPDDRGSSCVLFTSNPLSEFPLRDLPNELEDHMRFEAVQVEPGAVELTAPGIQDPCLVQLEMTPEERKQYWSFLENLGEGKKNLVHRIGGYPDCIQGDPKLEAHLVSHGLYCGDRSGYETGKAQGLWPGAVDWELLLQVDSEEKAGMMWGDLGRIYFLIHKSDLANRRFDKTWLVFQCS